MGQQWPAAGFGSLSVAVHAWDLLKEVNIIFFTSTIVWPQTKQQGGNTAPPINRKLDYRFIEHGPAHQNKTQVPPQSVSPIRKLTQASHSPSEGRQNERRNNIYIIRVPEEELNNRLGIICQTSVSQPWHS